MKTATPLFVLFVWTVLPVAHKGTATASGRVREARKRTEGRLKQLFQAQGLTYPPREVFFRLFKKEKRLDLWARSSRAREFTLVKSYSVCATSGELGPKRQRGDGQVPEGFYVIDRFNPNSSFHLSLGINYPNASDRILGGRADLGGDIFIHGACVSIGCLAITDDLIEEVYLATLAARARGQSRIPVHIFPTPLNEHGLEWLRRNYADQPALLEFWEGLQAGYWYFVQNKRVPRMRVDRKGRYRLIETAVAAAR